VIGKIPIGETMLCSAAWLLAEPGPG